MIPAPVKEPNTVYTCLKSLEKKGIYCEPKRIQLAISPGLDNVIVRHERFHRATNFLSVVGKRMTESGVEDIWIVSDMW